MKILLVGVGKGWWGGCWCFERYGIIDFVMWKGSKWIGYIIILT